jgi:hypothetical protein
VKPVPFWQRSLIVLVAMLVVSFLAGYMWHKIFGFSLPPYISGVIGGVTAVPIWELLKRVELKQK